MNKYLVVVAAVFAAVLGIVTHNLSRFDFQTIEGEKLEWNDMQGQWVVLNYFAEWCAPCLREVPELNEFYHLAKAANIRLLAASYDALSYEELSQLTEKYTMEFDVIRTDPQPKMPVNKPQQLPATFLISPEGKVVKKLLGEQTSDSLFAAIATAKGAAKH